MPKTNFSNKSVRSFRLSQESVRQLRTMASIMERSECDVIEIALDRMYREEIRFNRVLREAVDPQDRYKTNAQDMEGGEP